MKKTLSTLFLCSILSLGLGCSASEVPTPPKDKPPIDCPKHMKKQNFEKRLNLTEKQKEKAKAIHQKGFEQMKPIMEQMKALRKDIEETKKSSLDEKAKNEKIKKDFEELKSLDSKAHEIRKANSQEFEKILTKKQKKELDKMKAEGRAKFEKEHRPRPPFNMFGPEPWGPKPLFPPPPKPHTETK